MRRLLFYTLLVLAFVAFRGPAAFPGPVEKSVTDTASSVLGTWAGTSTCAGNRAACKDEKVVYRFVAVEGKPKVVRLFADKILEGKRVPMGALDFQYDADHRSLRCEFHRGTTHGIWAFQAVADTMTGTCVTLPEGTLVRHVTVHRANEKQLPKAPALDEYSADVTRPVNLPPGRYSGPSRPWTG